jgi:hypothetical protein
VTALSVAARAVLDAAFDVQDEWDSIPMIAAALRAVADQVMPEEPRPTGMRPAGETYSALEIRRAERMKLRQQFLVIANEMEGIP